MSLFSKTNEDSPFKHPNPNRNNISEINRINKLRTFILRDEFKVKLYLQDANSNCGTEQFLHITTKSLKDSNKHQYILSSSDVVKFMPDLCKNAEDFFNLLVDALENKDPENLALGMHENRMQFFCNTQVNSEFKCVTLNLSFDKYLPDETQASEPTNQTTSVPIQDQDSSDLKKMIQDLERTMIAKYEKLEGEHLSLLRTVEDQSREIYQLRNSLTTMERNNAINESIRNNPHAFLGGGGSGGPFSKKSNFL